MSSKKQATLWMLFSALSFTLMGMTVKLAHNIPVFEKVFVRNLITFFITGFIFIRNWENPFKQGKATKFLILRSLTGLGGVILNFYAISNLPLADSTMLNKLSPFFVIIFAGFFLSEGFNKKKITMLIFAFLGALLVIKPGFNLTIVPAIAGMSSAIFAGVSYTTVRYLSGKASPNMIIFYFSAISVIGTLPLMMINFQLPTFNEWLFLIGTGIFAGMGQISLTLAYHKAPASEISIYNYTSIIFALIIGVLFINDPLPDVFTILGGTIIFLSAYLNYRQVNKNVSH